MNHSINNSLPRKPFGKTVTWFIHSFIQCVNSAIFEINKKVCSSRKSGMAWRPQQAFEPAEQAAGAGKSGQMASQGPVPDMAEQARLAKRQASRTMKRSRNRGGNAARYPQG